MITPYHRHLLSASAAAIVLACAGAAARAAPADPAAQPVSADKGAPAPQARPGTPPPPAPPAPPAASSPPVSALANADPHAWGTFGVQTQWIDPAVKPGDDFDGYVNGRWNAQAQIPPDRTRAGAFLDLSDLSEARLHGVLEEFAAGSYPTGSDEARIAAAYKAFMDTAAIDAAGLTPAKPYLDAIAAAKTPRDLMRLFAMPGYSSPLDFGVGPDAKASDHYAIDFSESGLGLPDREYYLNDTPRFAAIRAKYVDYLAVMLGKAGYPDPAGSAKAVLDLETKLAKVTWDRATERDPNLTYNKLTAAEFDALAAPGLMQAFLDASGAGAAPYMLVDEIPPSADELKTANITPAQAATKLNGGVPAALALVQSEPMATWRAYLAAHFLRDHASVLPSDIDAANFAFYGTVLSGQPQQRPRWKRGIGAVEDEVGELLGSAYATRFYPPAEQARMAQLVANLRAAMAQDLTGLAWMSPPTRQEALTKLAAFDPKIGHPVKYKTYDGLVLDANTPLANQIAGAKWQSDFGVNRIGQPVDRTEWEMFPQTVNAYYNPTKNEIVFPAAILQPPFFNLSADPAVNYGAIGAVIGHETSHGFDDQGAKFDGKGNLRDWWTAADKANFAKLLDKLAAQYDAFCPFDDGKTCVNGRLTMGENIADLSGIAIAYKAYHLSLNGKPAPVIDGATGDQRFFMAWAQVWRSKVREEQARQFLLSDPHSPPQYRVDGIVRNIDAWYQAFDVEPGQTLYLPPDQRVRIW